MKTPLHWDSTWIEGQPYERSARRSIRHETQVAETIERIMRIFYSLYDRLLDRRALAKAFEKVRRASGTPGADGQTISDFQSCLLEELDRLVNELRTKAYHPQPVRRVTIPKPGGGERHLGIPAVRDRVI